MSNTTRKILVAFDPDKPTKSGSDFLAPLLRHGRVSLWGTRSNSAQEYGLVVFTGREVASADIFAKLVDGGLKISSVEDQVDLIETYISILNSTQIGQVYIVAADGAEMARFQLERAPLTAKEKGGRLP